MFSTAGIYDRIIAKWTSSDIRASVEDGESGDEDSGSHYSDEIIDDSELVQRFETRSLVQSSCQEYRIVSGDAVDGTPQSSVHGPVGLDMIQERNTDALRTKKGRVHPQPSEQREGSSRAPNNAALQPPIRSKGKNSGGATPKDPQRTSTKRVAPARPPTEGKKKQSTTTKSRKGCNSTCLTMLSSPQPAESLISLPTPAAHFQRLPGQGRKKAQATVKPEYLISHGVDVNPTAISQP